MLLFFALFIFVLLHVQFFVRNLVFGTDESTYFTFTIKYLYDREVATTSLWFSTACTAAFAIGYWVAYKNRPARRIAATTRGRYAQSSTPLWALSAAGLLQVVAAFYTAFTSGFDYQTIAETLLSRGFIFELRVVYLLLLCHLLLNVPISEVLSRPRFRSVRWVLIAYVVSTLLMQARSRVFEVVAVAMFAHLMWAGDRIRLKYIVAVGIALLAPNLIVLGRLGWPEDVATLVSGLFSFEYTILFNNLLSAAIDAGRGAASGFTFTPTLGLLLPSPVRAAFGLEVQKSDYYSDLSESAAIGGGGFSLLAEMFTNFGWASPMILVAVGWIIGRFNASAASVGRVSVLASAAPLLYIAFILAFRNDLGVFLKYVVQLLVIAAILHLLMARPTTRKATHVTA